MLDKTRGEPSMRSYLEIMGVNVLAIEAHEKGEKDVDTLHHIHLTENSFKIKKTSRVNNLQEEFILGKKTSHALAGGARVKTTLVVSDGLNHVKIDTHMPTMNGIAEVIDVKNLIQEDGNIFLKQELTIQNVDNGNSKTTTRWFIPIKKTPEIEFDDSEMEVETIAI